MSTRLKDIQSKSPFKGSLGDSCSYTKLRFSLNGSYAQLSKESVHFLIRLTVYNYKMFLYIGKVNLHNFIKLLILSN